MKKIFSILLASIALSSCVDTVILPENKTLDEDFWQKKGDVEGVVATAYAQLRDAVFQRNIIVWSDFRSDELVVSDHNSITVNDVTTALEEIYAMTLTSKNLFTQWYPLYSCINYCNLVLEKGAAVQNNDPSYNSGDWDANRAQVTALKALCYFYLIRVFRDVPLTDHAYLNSSDEFNLPQTPPAQVLQQCINDLEGVVDIAPTNDAYGDERDRGMLNKDGICALLADMYLWRASINHSPDDYQKCVQYCDRVIAAKKAAHIDSGEQPYYLTDCDKYYKDIWGTQNAEESIFEIQYKSDIVQNTALSNMYYGWKNYNSGSGYVRTTMYYAKYESKEDIKYLFKNNEDQRRYDFIYDIDKEDGQYAVRKFVAENGADLKTTTSSNTLRNTFYQNWIVYRLTDVMLMKAEALVQLQQPEEAYDIVKFVNDRANGNLNNYSASLNMEQLVLLERGRELCFEGKRWFDLLRYNFRHIQSGEINYNALMADIDHFPSNSESFFEIAMSKYEGASDAVKAKMPTEPYLYMPINYNEIKVNTELRQNPVFASK